MNQTEREGLLHAYLLDGRGGGRARGWEEVRAWTPEEGAAWVHLDATDAEIEHWLRAEAGLGEAACEALLAGATRPRVTPMDDGLLLVLRGVNLNPGADPEDMVSLRLWVDPRRAITASRRPLMAVRDVSEAIEEGRGPADPAEVLTALSDRLLDRMEPVLDELGEAVDDLEEHALTEAPEELQGALASLRQQTIGLRRHLAPQRDVLVRLAEGVGGPLDPEHRQLLQHMAHQVTRYVEDLDELRDRSAVVHDLLSSRQSERMNRQMLVLSLVAAIFLPLGLLTGLLGINVGGIPGADQEWAFLIVCALLLALAGLELWILHRMKWF